MAIATTRPADAAAYEYRTTLASGTTAIAVVAALIIVWAVFAFVAISPAVGAGALLFAAAVALFDGVIATPTRLFVTADAVTFGWWGRDRVYAPGDITVQHDVDHGRFTIRDRHRVLARFCEHEDGHALTCAFGAAGVEINSH